MCFVCRLGVPASRVCSVVRSLGRPPPSFVRGWFGLVRSGFWFGLVLARFGFVPFRSVSFHPVRFVMIDVVPVFFGSGVAPAACCDLVKLPSYGCWGGFSVSCGWLFISFFVLFYGVIQKERRSVIRKEKRRKARYRTDGVRLLTPAGLLFHFFFLIVLVSFHHSTLTQQIKREETPLVGYFSWQPRPSPSYVSFFPFSCVYCKEQAGVACVRNSRLVWLLVRSSPTHSSLARFRQQRARFFLRASSR